MRRVDSGKDSDAVRDWGQEEKGTTEDEMAGWHHQFDAQEFGWSLGVGDGQGGLACCDSWGLQRVRQDWATKLNWTSFKKKWYKWTYSLNIDLESELMVSSGEVWKGGIDWQKKNIVQIIISYWFSISIFHCWKWYWSPLLLLHCCLFPLSDC